MRFDTIMTTIESSDADDWVRVENFYEDKHSSFYVLREDVSITLAFGADHNEGEGWDHESWSHGFPDRKVYGEYLDVRYNGTTIHRDLILSVDGHRAYLPSGSIIGDQEPGFCSVTASSWTTNTADIPTFDLALSRRKPGEKIGRPSADQAEIARLTRELDSTRRRLAKTEAALDLVGKALSWRSSPRERTPRTSRGHVDRLLRRPGQRRGADRYAAALLGPSKATQDRRRRTSVPVPAEPAARPAPVNKLTDAEAAELIVVLNSQRFVDMAPRQIYATLLAEGTYLCSISTMYRTLERNRQVKDRRRLATHPPRKVRSCRPPHPGRSTRGTSPNSPARPRASTSTAT